MTNRFRVSSTLPRRLEQLGVAPATVLRHAGLPVGLFNQEKILVTTEEFFALYAGIGAVGGDPAIGLKLGTEGRVEFYDPIFIAALYARSLRDALGRLARYKQLTCPERIRLVERTHECAVHFDWLLAHEPEPALLVDVCFARVLSVVRRGSGREINPKHVEFQRGAAHREMYEAYFRCPVTFQASQNVLVFTRTDMDQPFCTHNADMLAVVAPQLEAELRQQLAQNSFGDQVKSVLKRLLAGQRPGIHEVARELRVSTRTLQRRLTEQGSTFQRVLEDARRELARHYLLHSSLDLNQTAYLLGYEDPNSFFRAFHHWEGTSPGQWRGGQRNSRPVQFTQSQPA